jgi:hypothetical protein
MRQFYCKSCNRYFTETLDFADLNKEYTHRQSDYTEVKKVFGFIYLLTFILFILVS